MLRLAAAALVLGTTAVGFSAPQPVPQPTPQPAPQQPAAADKDRVPRLIEALGDKDYTVRQNAQEELVKLGFAAYDALLAAANHEDLEIASRARYLLRLVRARWSTEQDPPEVQNLLQGYELEGAEQRAERIQGLATLPDLAGVPALCRLIRFERSPVLSGYAAVEVLNQGPVDQAARSRLARILRENLAGSSRSGAKWLLAYLRLREDPKTALAEWGNLVEAELGLWQRSPEKSSPEIVVSLLYLLAQVQAEQGNKPLAEQTAERARQLLSVSDPLGIEVRIEIAASLRRRGMIDWAEMEYRRLVGSGQPVVMIDASNHLAEMLHDQGKHLAAAEARRSALDVLQANRLESTGLNEFIKQMRARMNYFYACHWAEQGSAVKQLEYLELALKTDPGEVDTLIACYRLPNQTVQFRQRIMKLIEQDVAKTRNQIAARPEVAEPYNQYAWLVSNTQGDLDEALRFSKKSLELSPNNSAYLDTLAHVYFARGDLENAVKHQAMAVERDPYSNLITRELKRFRAALEEKAKGAKKPAGTDRKG